MEWSEEEIHEGQQAARDQDETQITDDAAYAIMTRAVELAAARGGTMTAEEMEPRFREIANEGWGRWIDRIREHISTLGARNAALEAERDAALKRAEEAEERCRLLAEAGQRLSAAVDKHVGGGDASLRLAALEEILSPSVLIGYLRNHHPRTRGESNMLKWPWETLERIANLYDMWSKEDKNLGKHECDVGCTHSGVGDDEMGRRDREGWPPFPCSPTCTHDDAATHGHPERVKDRSKAVRFACEHKAQWYVQVGTNRMECSGCGREVPSAQMMDTIKRVMSGGDLHAEDTLEHIAWIEEQRRGYEDGWGRGVEAMRAACWEIIQTELRLHGWGTGDGPWTRLKAAIEGVAP